MVLSGFEITIDQHSGPQAGRENDSARLASIQHSRKIHLHGMTHCLHVDVDHNVSSSGKNKNMVISSIFSPVRNKTNR